MCRAMIHAMGKNKAFAGKDLEVPVDVPAEILGKWIAIAVKWEDETTEPLETYHYTIQAYPIGRTLQSQETLVQAGLWDGAYLTLGRKATPRYWLQSVTGQTYALTAPELIVGRLTPEDASRQDKFVDLSGEPGGETVSRRQAHLTLTDRGWLFDIIGDVAARTFIYQSNVPVAEAPALKDRNWQRGTKIELPYRLKNGVWLRFGNVSLKFRAAE